MSLKSLIRRAKEAPALPGSSGSSAAAKDIDEAPATLPLSAQLHSATDASARVASDVAPVWLLEDWLPESAELRILDLFRTVHQKDFVQLRGKRTARFGGEPGPPFAQESLPSWLQQLCDAVGAALPPAVGRARSGGEHDAAEAAQEDKLRLPNHVLVNHYRPGEGIMPHTDGPAYEPWAAILSLGGAAVMDFWRDHAHAASGAPAALSLLLPPRSLLVFSGAAYAQHLHGIADRTTDFLQDGQVANWTSESRRRWCGSDGGFGESAASWARTQLLEGDAAAASTLSRAERVSLTLRHVPAAGAAEGPAGEGAEGGA